MHIIVGLLALVGALAFWYWRVKQAKEAGEDLLDGANDIRLTVRRLMYKRTQDVHPADSVEDPRLAAAGIAVAIATLDMPISQGEIAALTRTSREIFDVTEREALDIVSFGRWIADQCNTHGEAVRRLAKVVAKHAGPDAGPDLLRMITEVATADGGQLGEDELEAIQTVRCTLGVG